MTTSTSLAITPAEIAPVATLAGRLDDFTAGRFDELTTGRFDLAAAGQAANEAAAGSAFGRYQDKKADNTLRTQRAGLGLFAAYLGAVGVEVDAARLVEEPDAWRGVTWGLVDGFVVWMIREGYSIASVNQRLSVVKTYARQAARAGALSAAELTLIRTVEGYSREEGRRKDDRRETTRRSAKKAEAVGLTQAQLKALKQQPDTPQGRRDRVLVCLLADHGLRVGEAARLRVEDLDLAEGRMTFYRPKVGLTQNHELSEDTKRALRRYIEAGDAPAAGPLLRASAGAGRLTHAGVSERNLSERVRMLGLQIGVEGLSAHDLRHAWATQAARNGTPIDRLQQAGGWSSPSMPLRYIEASEIANRGVLV